eukprot:TRINITY_DN11331_c0_g1_i1.p1 TRINITY_DN11331_c0_g1~~TRINITY_DN11331_c0_g1_i1.p1  ORF type:complete len:320 (+),score=53.49 TRINITY_DN11331_c0_g1_i1:140-1099(+)
MDLKLNQDILTETKNKNRNDNLPTSSHLLAGGVAGLIADFCTHPIDTIRARLQVQGHNNNNSIRKYNGTFDGFRSILKHEGWRAFYKGFAIVSVSTIPAHALYFAGYEMAKRNFQKDRREEDKSVWVHLVSGLWADVCGSIIWVPMDVIKQRLQVQQSSASTYRGSFHAFQTIVKQEGAGGLFKGFLPAIATYGPFVAIYFATYEKAKLFAKDVTSSSSLSEIPFWAQLVCGATAGAISAMVTCPMDVIKTRIQVESKKSEGAYKGGLDALRRIMKEEGFGAFTKGMTARILWIAPGTAITIGLYEQFKSIILKNSRKT